MSNPAAPWPAVWLGHVLQHEFGLQRAPELPVGGVEPIRGLEAVEPLQGGGRGGVPGGERRVELADAVPLLGDEAEVHGPTAALEDRLEDAVVAVSVGAVDPLAGDAGCGCGSRTACRSCRTRRS